MASSWILFFSYQDDARSNTHKNHHWSTEIRLIRGKGDKGGEGGKIRTVKLGAVINADYL